MARASTRDRPLSAPSSTVTPCAGDLAGLVDQVGRRHPSDTWLMGGGELVSAFQQADLIDTWSPSGVVELCCERHRRRQEVRS